MNGKCTTRHIQENTNSSVWWELLIKQKRHRIKKKSYRLNGQSPQAGRIKQALRGALHQILVENLDAQRRPETPRLKDNIKTDFRETRCGVVT